MVKGRRERISPKRREREERESDSAAAALLATDSTRPLFSDSIDSSVSSGVRSSVSGATVNTVGDAGENTGDRCEDGRWQLLARSIDSVSTRDAKKKHHIVHTLHVDTAQDKLSRPQTSSNSQSQSQSRKPKPKPKLNPNPRPNENRRPNPNPNPNPNSKLRGGTGITRPELHSSSSSSSSSSSMLNNRLHTNRRLAHLNTVREDQVSLVQSSLV